MFVEDATAQWHNGQSKLASCSDRYFIAGPNHCSVYSVLNVTFWPICPPTNRVDKNSADRNVNRHEQAYRQEAQLMLTNPRDALRGQSRSPNIVPFHMLRIVSYCAIETLSLRHCLQSIQDIFTIFDFKNTVTLKWSQRSLKVIESCTIR